MRAYQSDGEIEPDERRQLLAVAEMIASTPTVKSMNLAAELAKISYGAVTRFATLASATKELFLLRFLARLVE